MTKKMTVTTYDVEHDKVVRITGHLDRQIVIKMEAAGHGVEIKMPPEVAAELADNLATTVSEVLAQNARTGPAGHA